MKPENMALRASAPSRSLAAALAVAAVAGWLAASGCTEERPGVLDSGAPDTGPPPDTVCTPGYQKCDGSTLKTCKTDGLAWEEKDCSKDGKRCLKIGGFPECTDYICDPGLPDCADDGVTSRTCSQDGKQWVSGKVCDLSKGEICYTGKCENACAFEAKNRQNVGCVFYPVNLDNKNPDRVGVVVSNPNKATARVTLSRDGASLGTRDVKAGQLATFLIDAGQNMLQGTGLKRYAFKLVSTLPVAAYQFSPLNKAEQRSNDASLLVSQPALGKLYYVFSAPVDKEASRSFVTVVGTQAGTKVTVTPSFDSDAGGGIPAVKRGSDYTATLDELDVLQLSTSTRAADPTGTRIRSDKPVAVFGGNSCVRLPEEKSYCDHVQEQMFPVETWGWSYMAVKFMPRGKTPEDDWWRVLASENGTTVTLKGGKTLPSVPRLEAGQYYQINSSESFVILSDKPIGVAHYMLGQEAVTPPLDETLYKDGFQTGTGCSLSASSTSMGDPAMSVAVPVSQYRTEYLFLTPDTYMYDFVSILVAETDNPPDILLDGKSLPAKLARIGDTKYREARLRVSDGPHRLAGTAAFGIEVYGYDCNVSYSCGGGLNLKEINPIK